MNRCALTDLLVAQCACRLHRGGPEPKPPGRPPRLRDDRAWPARYPGVCVECGDPIYVGDRIVGWIGGWVHGECPDGT